MKRSAKQVTNEELARMIAEGFNGVTEQFNGVTEQFNGVAEQFNGVHKSINDIGVKVEAIDNRLRIVETKLDKALYTEINRLEARLKKVEEKVGIK